MSLRAAFRICLIGIAFSRVALPQAAQDKIEIDGVMVSPGITTDQAKTLFAGKQTSQSGDGLYVLTPKSVGPGKPLPVIVGTLHIEKDIVVSACRNWDMDESTDAELARVMFAAIVGRGPEEVRQPANIETTVSRRSDTTLETIVIRFGQRTVTIGREQRRGGNYAGPVLEPLLSWATVEECVTKPGWTMGAIK